jgi:hypothetical protein
MSARMDARVAAGVTAVYLRELSHPERPPGRRPSVLPAAPRAGCETVVRGRRRTSWLTAAASRSTSGADRSTTATGLRR